MFIENTTGSPQETKVKQEDKNVKHPPVQRNSSVNHNISINNILNKERVNSTGTYNSEDKKANTNRSKSTHSNTIASKEFVEQLKNITHNGEKKEIEDTKNTTKYPLFLIASRSRKIGGKHRIKIVNKNEDYGRDCFEDIEENTGSQGKI